MRLLTTPFILTIMNLFFSTALIPRSTMFYTLGSKSSMFRISSITTEVPYARKLIRHQWTLTQKLAALGSDIWVLQFDGGSRGNPGRAGSGSVIYKSTLEEKPNKLDEKCSLPDSEEMWSGYHYLGENVTNNVAEYSGLIEGLKQAVSMSIPSLLIQGDSQLILYQVEGKYKVKSEILRPLHSEAMDLLRCIPKYLLEYIPRANNARADELSNFAMDRLQNTSALAALSTGTADALSNIAEKIRANIESDAESRSTFKSDIVHLEPSACMNLEVVEEALREQDSVEDGSHLVGTISPEGTVRIIVPEADVIRNDDQTVTVTIAISLLKSLLVIDSSADIRVVPEKIRKLKQSVDKLEDNRVKLPLKEKKTVIQKVPISSAVETDSLVAKSSKRLKKTDTESITISIKSPLVKPKKGPKTVIGKNIEMSL